MTVEEFKKQMLDRIQQSIDYWESVVELHPNDYETFDDMVKAWRAALERGQEKGILDELYYAHEILTGQRK